MDNKNLKVGEIVAFKSDIKKNGQENAMKFRVYKINDVNIVTEQRMNVGIVPVHDPEGTYIVTKREKLTRLKC